MKKNIKAVVQLLVFSFVVYSFAAVHGSNKRYDMTFVDADFQSVFHSISVLAGVDILLTPEVQGRLTMTVTQKTWTEMMDIVCNMHDLTWLVEGNYISVQRTISYMQKVIRESEKLEQSDAVAPLSRRSFQIKHASAGEMAKVLETIKSPQRGRISVVERNNAIIVYDTERRLEQMQSTLNELDVETLQIVITAKLVVVDSRLANELGVDWTNVGVGNANSRVSGTFKNTPGTGAIAAGEGVAGAGVVYPTELTVQAFDGNMSAVISNILSDSRSEVLASPQISTLDHTKAQIFMGEQISIRVMDASGQSSQQMIETGIKLTVTPHVAGDNRILLELHPENNGYTYDASSGMVIINKQEAQTKVVVSDGETVVIGGLTNNEEKEAEIGIPFLKDIPILGYLFKHTRKEVNKKDLIIFVTPRIMRNYLASSPATNGTPVASKRAAVEENYEDADDGWE